MTDDQGWGQTGYYNHPVLENTLILTIWQEMVFVLIVFMQVPQFVLLLVHQYLTGRVNDRTGVV